MEKIKYEDIEAIGAELLKKNNNTFYRSKLSKQMEKIFIAANKVIGIKEIEDEYYMKSSAIPDRVYYIYSEQLNKLAKDKICDVVLFKDKPCIWFYSKNAIDMIGEDPVKAIYEIYNTLLNVFKNYSFYGSFLNVEYKVVRATMSIRFLNFVSNNYYDLKEHVEKLTHKCLNDRNVDNLPPYITISPMDPVNDYTDDSVRKFIDDVNSKFIDEYYYTNKEYLESYMILEQTVTVIAL